MMRWWGAGRRKAREAVRQEAIRRQRDVVERAVEEARRYPPTHVQRWRSLEPLTGISDDVIADVAVAMLRSADRAEVLLGTQLVDPGTFVGLTDPQRQADLIALLDGLCRPDGDPDVIAAALGTWSDGNPAADARLAQVLTHPSPTVRARAAYLYAGRETVPAPQRLARLRERLDLDDDATVREQSAAGLQLMLRDARFGDPDEGTGPAPELAADLVEVLRRHRDDPSPAVRAIAFATLAGEDTDQDLARLVRELTDPDVHPGFVSAVPAGSTDLPARPEQAAAVAAALHRLRDSGWPERVPDGDFPGPAERRRALGAAIAWVDRSR